MMRLLFQNSRMALAFVVLTVLGAVAMIGSQDNGGLVTRAVSLSEGQRGLLAGGTQPVAAEGQKAPPSVFGEYDPNTAASPAAAPSQSSSAAGGNPMTAPMASDAVIAGPAAADPVISEDAAPQQ